jgi:6-phosphogluconolactonase|tara:strand:- start:52 stop:1095 length:1044 start_codon:yes stop_codon:yes gene_type:complete
MNAIFAALLVVISASKDKTLHLYELNPKTGALVQRAKIDLPGAPGSQFVSPDGNRLYVSVRTANSVSAYRIDHSKKTLVPLGITNIEANAAYIATDRTGHTLLWASYSGGVVGSHAIDRKGAVRKDSLSRIETQRCAHSILTDTSNKFAFVPHTGPNAVYQFRFNAVNGKLSANDPFTASPAAGLEPRHLAFHPKLPIVYCDDEKGDSVTAYHFNQTTGQLKAFHTSSTLPVGFDGGKNTCADIEITHDGKFVYASNRGHNSIAGFAVDAKTGKLKSIGQFTTGEVPRSFNLGPNNKWLVAAGQRSNDLHIYQRNPKTGKLTKVHAQPTGQNPSWVQFIPVRKLKKK